MKKKPVKTVRIRRLKKALDSKASERVRERDRHCQMPGCSKRKGLAAHHWWELKSRSLALRWDIRNMVALCWFHHKFTVHTYSVASSLMPFFQKMMDKVGPEGMANMELRRQMRWDYDEDELGILLDGLRTPSKSNKNGPRMPSSIPGPSQSQPPQSGPSRGLPGLLEWGQD